MTVSVLHSDTAEGTLRWIQETYRGRLKSVCVLFVIDEPDDDMTFKVTRSTMNVADLSFLAHLLHQEIHEMTDKALAEHEAKLP